jgi:hypothetical protein
MHFRKEVDKNEGIPGEFYRPIITAFESRLGSEWRCLLQQVISKVPHAKV